MFWITPDWTIEKVIINGTVQKIYSIRKLITIGSENKPSTSLF